MDQEIAVLQYNQSINQYPEGDRILMFDEYLVANLLSQVTHVYVINVTHTPEECCAYLGEANG